jgi:hypothetical protein
VNWGSDPGYVGAYRGKADIEVLVQENWIKKNDELVAALSHRLCVAAHVKKYGKAIYEGEDGECLALLEPVHEENVLNLVEAVVQRTGLAMPTLTVLMWT